MKIAVSSTGQALDDTVESRFGRCPFFLIIDPETLAFEPIPNPNISLGGGAGIQSAQLMAEKGVSVVLTGNCGPNAFRTFGAAGIKVMTGVSGRVREAVEQFKSGQLNHSPEPNVQSHFGMGKGQGRGMGRGMGGGGGCGFNRSAVRATGSGLEYRDADSSSSGDPLKGETITSLKKLIADLRGQMEMIESKIRDMEKT
jgi:predicted Fe-Mo cluster-binding NifX family protein